MSSLYQLLLFAIFNPLHSLKLLAAGDDDSIDLAVSNLPEEWEADITFSYKPLAGKCKEVGTKFVLLNKGNGDAGYANGKDGQICTEKCKTGPTAGDIVKFCDVIGKKEATYLEVIAAWKTALNKKGISRCARIMAKVYSMSSLDPKCKANPVTAFDMKASDCSVRGFKGSDGGKPVTTVAAPGYFCYTQAGIAWAKNDPKVKNIHGEEFDILSTGTFKMLDVTQASNSLLNVEATIDRAGSQCGATYIQNVTIRGAWVEEAEVNHIQVRAKAAVPKHRALEINVNDTWMAASRLAQSSDLTDGLAFAVPYASSGKLDIVLHQVRFAFSIDSHRIHETTADSRLAHRFANFLNMQIDGIHNIEGSRIGGILGTDDHDSVTQMPEDCDKNLQLILKEGPDSLSHVTLI